MEEVEIQETNMATRRGDNSLVLFGREVTAKHLLIGAGIGFLLWKFYKSQKEKSEEKALMDMKIKEMTNNKLAENDLEQIQVNVHDFLRETGSYGSEQKIASVVKSLTIL